MSLFVYMLRCSDGSFYTGSTNNLETRINQHSTGHFGGYTSSRLPVALVWSEHFDRIADGIAVERKLKGWSRAKKEALIRSDWISMQKLASRRGGKKR
ncbi:MAG: hypothetical protein A4S14_10630 [Proteobacteria bacterium SG_bin9]|nr:MAG: hypothetical protein A4S14_10630 [Proteobacteria bacterium SG_bin9]